MDKKSIVNDMYQVAVISVSGIGYSMLGKAIPRVQHGLSPSGNLINMHKIGKIASVGFSSQL